MRLLNQDTEDSVSKIIARMEQLGFEDRLIRFEWDGAGDEGWIDSIYSDNHTASDLECVDGLEDLIYGILGSFGNDEGEFGIGWICLEDRSFWLERNVRYISHDTQHEEGPIRESLL